MAQKTIKISPIPQNCSEELVKNALGDVDIARIAIKKSEAYVEFET